MFDLENEGQGQGVQHAQRYHSMANINLYKSHTSALLTSPHRFRDIHISKFVTWKVYDKVTMYNICSGANQWQIPYFLSDGNGNICISSVYLSTML